jgi:hypothetical protein
MKGRSDLIEDDPRNYIDKAAGREWYDHPHGSCRPRFIRDSARRPEQTKQKNRER